jgi:uncharacterized protein
MMLMPMDPVFLIITLVGLPLIYLPQLWVKNTFNRMSQIPNQRGISGKEVAVDMLRRHNITDVQVEETPQHLGDHYSPNEKMVRLSPEVYRGTSIASAAIAAHEIGHAIQHATKYYPVVLRGNMFPMVNLGSQLGPMLLMAGFAMTFMMRGMSDLAWYISIGGVVLFGLAVAFHFVTLPVEIDASMRAMRVLREEQYLVREELPQAKKVLTSAAFTYIATAIYALLELAGYVYRLMVLSRSRE